MDLISLFFVSFVAATFFPAQSEALLAGLVIRQTHPVVMLVAVASVGNILGACLNWLLGRYAVHLMERRWFPVSAAALERASQWYQRFGVWSLLFSWVPFVGDPLTLAAGVLRTRFWLFLLLVSIGKIGRYIAVVMLLPA